VTSVSTGFDPSRQSAHFLSLLTWTRDDLDTILVRARDILETPDRISPLAGRRVMLSWLGPARSATEFYAALERAGCHRQVVSQRSTDWGDESGRPGLSAALVLQTRQHSDLQQVARCAGVPVVNAGSSYSEPYRVLAEIFGLERGGVDIDGTEIAWVGDPGPRLNSWLEASVRFGFSLDVRLPAGGVTDPALTAYIGARARGRVSLSGSISDPIRAPIVLVAGETRFNSVARTGRVIVVGPERPSLWGPAVDSAVAQGVIEEVWVRTARARAVQE
jgi:ornithine carbamoyltransferase